MRYTAEVRPAPARIRSAQSSTLLFFLVHGLIAATWISRIPDVKISLKLENGPLGLALLGGACGSLLSIPLTGRLANRFGSRLITGIGSVAFCLALILPALATNLFFLIAALLVYGAAAGMMDVSMNVQGVEVEQARGAPVMSRFHALFSLGAMAGAALGGLMAARRVPPVVHFAGAAVIYLCLTAIAYPGLLRRSEPAPSAVADALRTPRSLRRMPVALVVLSVIAFCTLLSEGAMADWIAVYLRQVLRAGPGVAPAGYAVFSGAMAVFRLLGDWITLRLGSELTLRAGSLIGAGGLALALLAPGPLWAMPGFAATGAGFSIIVPILYGASGRVDGVSSGAGVATVSGLGYIGFLVGPPLIGFSSQLITLRLALGIVVGLCLLSATLSPWVRVPSAMAQPAGIS